MSAWTTLDMAKLQVGYPLADTAQDARLTQMLEAAEDLVLSYLQSSAPSNAYPPQAKIREAMYLQFAELWRFRGDDEEGMPPQSRIAGSPSVQIERCLFGLRPPSLA